MEAKLASIASNSILLPKDLSSFDNIFESIKLIQENKSYIKLSSCEFDHIIYSKKLTSQEKLFFTLVESMAYINLCSPKRTKERSIINSAQSLATMLGVSRRTIFTIQQSLKEKGYLLVNHSQCNKQHERNHITPLIPDQTISSTTSNGKEVSEIQITRSAISDTELFITINFELLKQLLSNKDIKKSSKIIWLYVYKRSFVQNKINGGFIFNDTIDEMADKINLSKNVIKSSLSELKDKKFLYLKEFKIDRNKDINRKDKNLLAIAAAFPENMLNLINARPNRSTRLKAIDVQKIHHEDQKIHHEDQKRSPLSNKNLTNKNFNNKIIPDATKNKIDNYTQDEIREPLHGEDFFKSINFKRDLNVEKKSFIVLDKIIRYEEKIDDIDLIIKFINQEERETLTRFMGYLYSMLENTEKYNFSKNDMYKIENKYEILKDKILNKYKELISWEQITKIQKYSEVGHEKLDTTLSDNKIYFSSVEEVFSVIGYSNTLQELINNQSKKIKPWILNRIKGCINKNYIAKSDIVDINNQVKEKIFEEAICFFTTWKPRIEHDNEKQRVNYLINIIGNRLKTDKWFPPKAYNDAHAKKMEQHQKAEQILKMGMSINEFKYYRDIYD